VGRLGYSTTPTSPKTTWTTNSHSICASLASKVTGLHSCCMPVPNSFLHETRPMHHLFMISPDMLQKIMNELLQKPLTATHAVEYIANRLTYVFDGLVHVISWMFISNFALLIDHTCQVYEQGEEGRIVMISSGARRLGCFSASVVSLWASKGSMHLRNCII